MTARPLEVGGDIPTQTGDSALWRAWLDAATPHELHELEAMPLPEQVAAVLHAWQAIGRAAQGRNVQIRYHGGFLERARGLHRAALYETFTAWARARAPAYPVGDPAAADWLSPSAVTFPCFMGWGSGMSQADARARLGDVRTWPLGLDPLDGSVLAGPRPGADGLIWARGVPVLWADDGLPEPQWVEEFREQYTTFGATWDRGAVYEWPTSTWQWWGQPLTANCVAGGATQWGVGVAVPLRTSYAAAVALRDYLRGLSPELLVLEVALGVVQRNAYVAGVWRLAQTSDQALALAEAGAAARAAQAAAAADTRETVLEVGGTVAGVVALANPAVGALVGAAIAVWGLASVVFARDPPNIPLVDHWGDRLPSLARLAITAPYVAPPAPPGWVRPEAPADDPPRRGGGGSDGTIELVVAGAVLWALARAG